MSPREVVEVLRACPVLTALPAGEIERLACTAREEAHRSREYVFREGDPAHSLFLLRSGRVKIVRHTRAGKDVVLEVLGPGEVFGGVAVLERRPYPASAQATEASVTLAMAANIVVPLAERHPSIVREMALMMGRRLRAAHDAVTSLATDPVEARLAGVLLRLARREGVASGGGLGLPYHLTRQTLADMSGTTVETAIRLVSRWIREGLVTDEEGRLVVRDPGALRARAEGGYPRGPVGPGGAGGRRRPAPPSSMTR
jgi:CRP/FNR family transcriptional regulator